MFASKTNKLSGPRYVRPSCSYNARGPGNLRAKQAHAHQTYLRGRTLCTREPSVARRLQCRTTRVFLWWRRLTGSKHGHQQTLPHRPSAAVEGWVEALRLQPRLGFGLPTVHEPQRLRRRAAAGPRRLCSAGEGTDLVLRASVGIVLCSSLSTGRKVIPYAPTGTFLTFWKSAASSCVRLQAPLGQQEAELLWQGHRTAHRRPSCSSRAPRDLRDTR